MLGEKHAKIRSMHIDHGRDELDVVRWLLQECETDALTDVTINSETACYGQMILPLGEKLGSRAGTMKHPMDADTADPSPASGLLSFFTERLKPQTRRTLAGALAQFCPSITSPTLVKQAEDVPSLGAMKSLQRLEAHFVEDDDIGYLFLNYRISRTSPSPGERDVHSISSLPPCRSSTYHAAENSSAPIASHARLFARSYATITRGMVTESSSQRSLAVRTLSGPRTWWDTTRRSFVHLVRAAGTT